ncbi:MAG: Gfo/Idh/MocA family oxidoreductase [Aestuariivirga sp.]|uniref:Gfo/Idh/MocA family protein n=1 Tax=Aestuariivirga sp. TaxID=2650926 RepID=UPI0025BF95FC|nr:Gfo/Idh/MocA family oxidoreductase [Aestuariivirga sp.]MCA3559757.1 Gfo/Idh/MocA family oxidoreductase [Aestuariivirga sp.]
MGFKLAIIGLGKIAQDQHLPVVARNKDFELAAVVSSRGGHGDVPAFRTPAELFRSGLKLDAVALCMPPEPRFAIARDALDAGLHVLMEKPPTTTMGELDAITAHAHRAKRILFTTWHSQYNKAVDEAQRLLKGKRVTRLHVSWKEDVRHWHPGQDWIWEPGGFGVFDPGINAFSIVTKILPQPVFVKSAMLETPRNKATPIAAQITFKPSWEGEAELTADLDWRQTGEQSWSIDVEAADGLQLALRRGGSELYIAGKLTVQAPPEEYKDIYVHFAQLLREGRSHVDGAPLQLVSDSFMMGRRTETEPFL